MTQASLLLLSHEMTASLINPFGDRAIFNQARAKLVFDAKKKDKLKVESSKKLTEINERSVSQTN